MDSFPPGSDDDNVNVGYAKQHHNLSESIWYREKHKHDATGNYKFSDYVTTTTDAELNAKLPVPDNRRDVYIAELVTPPPRVDKENQNRKEEFGCEPYQVFYIEHRRGEHANGLIFHLEQDKSFHKTGEPVKATALKRDTMIHRGYIRVNDYDKFRPFALSSILAYQQRHVLKRKCEFGDILPETLA